MPNTLQVEVDFKTLAGAYVIVVQDSEEPYSVVYVANKVDSGLPSVLEFGPTYAYASHLSTPYRTGTSVDIALLSDTCLSEGTKLEFDGTQFVSDGSVGSDFSYGLHNGQDARYGASIGLAQEVSVNNIKSVRPLTLRWLNGQTTAYYDHDNIYRIGVGWSPGGLQSGQLLQTSLFEVKPARSAKACVPSTLTLGVFVKIAFSGNCTELAAQYDPARGAFNVVRR